MFKRILNHILPTSLTLCALLLVSCGGGKDAAEVNIPGDGGKTDSYGKFPGSQKAEPVTPLDENALMIAGFDELSRVNRGTVKMFEKIDGDDKIGCIFFKQMPEGTNPFLVANYRCAQEDAHKSASVTVHEQRGTEKYIRQPFAATFTGTWLTKIRKKYDTKMDLTGGDITRSTSLVFRDHGASTLTLNSTTLIRPSSRAPRKSAGEQFAFKITNEELEVANGKKTIFYPGMKFEITYIPDSMILKSSIRRIVFTATDSVTFPEYPACPRPIGTFQYETFVNKVVVKTGAVAASEAGLKLQESGAKLIPWPANCQEN